MVEVPRKPDLWTLARLVDNASKDAVNRVRRRSTLWWRAASACEGWTRADVVEHLVAGYAAAAERIERGAAPPPAGGYRGPARPAREAVLADQLAVTARDLVEALRTAPPGGPAHLGGSLGGSSPGGEKRRNDRRGTEGTVEQVAAVMLAETLVHLYDVDPRPLDDTAAGAALAYLHADAAHDLHGSVGSLGELLLAVERGPLPRQREV